jgi:hypothetical protein
MPVPIGQPIELERSSVRADHAPDHTLPHRNGGAPFAVFRPGTSARRMRVIDAIVVAWMVAWILIGLAVARDVRKLATLSDTVTTAGTAVGETGRALHALEKLPFVGDRIAGIARRVDAAAGQAIRSGRESGKTAHDLSVLLGVSVAVAPTVPVLAMYLPFRVSRGREARAIRRAAARAVGEPMFEEYLAHRAVENLPYHRLRAITPNPWRDLEAGRHTALADAELRRLGIRRKTPRRGRGAP